MDIQQYQSSDYAIKATRLLLTMVHINELLHPSIYDFGMGGNHALCILVSANFMRTGILVNFSMQDYLQGVQEAERKKSKDIVFTVGKHKTAAKHCCYYCR